MLVNVIKYLNSDKYLEAILFHNAAARGTVNGLSLATPDVTPGYKVRTRGW